jgi:hypothetical protein
MTRPKLIELYDRGLNSFDSLTQLERDAFVVNDVDIYHEMEGDFADYLLSGGHEQELSWLADTLQRIGDTDSAAILSQLRGMDDFQRRDISILCAQYYDLRHARWEMLKRHLAQHGAELVENE